MLTMSRSPLRVSFVGGGTDYPQYFNQFPGAVLGSTIDKYIFIATLPMVGYAEKRFRITYKTVEAVDTVDEIKHNAIRAVLKEFNYDRPLNIAILSDLPGNSGLGSSSSFTVGFIRLISSLMGKDITKFDLMKKAVYIEQTVLRERVGIQDQTHAAFGGLNHYTFQGDNFSIHPVRMQTDCREALNESLCLIYTGMQRSASTVLEEQIRNTDESRVSRELSHMVTLCTEGVKVLEGNRPDAMLKDMGALLSEGWATKRKLSSTISNGSIDEIYQAGMAAGAYGGKLCGAGAGGFFLFLANKDTQKKLCERFGENNFVRIGTVDDGAMIIRTGQVGELHG